MLMHLRQTIKIVGFKYIKILTVMVFHGKSLKLMLISTHMKLNTLNSRLLSPLEYLYAACTTMVIIIEKLFYKCRKMTI